MKNNERVLARRGSLSKAEDALEMFKDMNNSMAVPEFKAFRIDIQVVWHEWLDHSVTQYVVVGVM